MTRNSDTHPLRIDSFSLWAGKVGLTICPGKRQAASTTGSWDRDLNSDLTVIEDWPADSVISLLESHEMEYLHVPQLPERMVESCLNWLHMPIVDQMAPEAAFLKQWRYVRLVLAHQLMQGQQVLLHCMGGLGRAGTVAAMLCIDAGMPAWDAIRTVRAARSQRAIETREQEAFLESYTPEFVLTPENVRASLTLWGGAAGDALGYPVEFEDSDWIYRHYGDQGIHPQNFFGTPQISDDTQMTLYTLASLADNKEKPQLPILRKAWLHWFEGQTRLPASATTPALSRLQSDRAVNHPRAPGNTCMSALRDGARGSLNDRVNQSKGTGAVMRIAPIAFLNDRDEREKVILAMESAALTHGHDYGIGVTALFTAMLSRRVYGHEKQELWHILDDYPELLSLLPELPIFINPLMTAPPTGEGWVAEEALEFALYYASQPSSIPLSDLMAMSASHGGDSDTTASLTAQLAATSHRYDSSLVNFVLRLDAYDALADTVTSFFG
jgi:ADP-ribosyl-[dinitrogen reductase] hydrolase